MKYLIAWFGLASFALMASCQKEAISLTPEKPVACSDIFNKNNHPNVLMNYFPETASIIKKVERFAYSRPAFMIDRRRFFLYANNDIEATMDIGENTISIVNKNDNRVVTKSFQELISNTYPDLDPPDNITFSQFDIRVSYNGFLHMYTQLPSFEPLFAPDKIKNVALLRFNLSNPSQSPAIIYAKEGYEALKAERYSSQAYQIYYDKRYNKRFLSHDMLGKVEISSPYWLFNFDVYTYKGTVITTNKGDKYRAVWQYRIAPKTHKINSKKIFEFPDADIESINLVGNHLYVQGINRKLPFVYNLATNKPVDYAEQTNNYILRNVFRTDKTSYIFIYEKPDGAKIYYQSVTGSNHEYLCETSAELLNRPHIKTGEFQFKKTTLNTVLKSNDHKKLFIWLHGGPWENSGFSHHPIDTLLNKEFDVLHINYPGSTGYGHRYTETRLTDTQQTLEAIRNFIAEQKDKYASVSVGGHSFGAYLGTLLAREDFDETVTYYLLAGPNNLNSLIEYYQRAVHRTNTLSGDFIKGFSYDPKLDPDAVDKVFNYSNAHYFWHINDSFSHKSYFEFVGKNCAKCISHFQLKSHTPLPREYDKIVDIITETTGHK